MKILIVDDESINASKLKLVISKYGVCDIANDLNTAVDMYIKSHGAQPPYGLITLELDKLEKKGVEVAVAIRKWETENNKTEKARILIFVPEAHRLPLTPDFQALNIQCLIKPYNRKKLEIVLSKLGLQKNESSQPGEVSSVKVIEASPSPPPSSLPASSKPSPTTPSAASPPPPPPKKLVDPQVEAVLKKLTALVHNPEAFNGVDARIILEELVKKGGKQAELLMGQFITNTTIEIPVRMELVRSAGYILSPNFLIPLNRVVDSEENIRLVEGALISISKYNNQRALSILNKALKKLKNPMLLNTIRRQTAKIKRNNPVLSILPRFLTSYKSHKNFRVTVDVLKKILTPKDTHLFINYLKSGNQVIEDGAFELLCASGDPAVKREVFDFFDQRILTIPCVSQAECGDLYFMTLYMSQYYKQNPDFVEENVSELRDLYSKSGDQRVKQTIITILCKSHDKSVLVYVESLFNTQEEFKEWIVEELAGNPEAVEFLFERYHAGEDLKGKVIQSLLQSEKGVLYFIEHFFDFDLDKQEMIIRNMPFASTPYYLSFIRKIYETQLYGLKNYLLKVLKENYLFGFDDILFAPENQREFMFMGKDYFETIMRLYPIRTLMMFLEKIAGEDISTNKKKKYLEWVAHIAQLEPVLIFRDIKILYNLFEKIAKSNNNELNTIFFAAFENIRFLDIDTYKHFMELTNKFVSFRGANITPNEKAAASKVKQRLIDHFPDIRESQNLHKELKVVFSNKPIIVEQLVKLVKSTRLGISLNFERVTSYLAAKLKNLAYISKDDREVFFMQFPIMGRLIRELIESGDTLTEVWDEIPVDGSRVEELIRETRVVINFNKKGVSAVLKDQLRLMIPGIRMQSDVPELGAEDILICDTVFLKEYTAKKGPLPRQILIYIENRMDYAPFRSYNAKAFLKPLSGYRVVRMMLQELFFPS